jgi:hypothetical protein
MASKNIFLIFFSITGLNSYVQILGYLWINQIQNNYVNINLTRQHINKAEL